MRSHLHSFTRNNRQDGRPGRRLQRLEDAHHLDGEFLVVHKIERPGRGYWIRAPHEHEVGHTPDPPAEARRRQAVRTVSGAEGGNRTHTPRREPDFESGTLPVSARNAAATATGGRR